MRDNLISFPVPVNFWLRLLLAVGVWRSATTVSVKEKRKQTFFLRWWLCHYIKLVFCGKLKTSVHSFCCVASLTMWSVLLRLFKVNRWRFSFIFELLRASRLHVHVQSTFGCSSRYSSIYCRCGCSISVSAGQGVIVVLPKLFCLTYFEQCIYSYHSPCLLKKKTCCCPKQHEHSDEHVSFTHFKHRLQPASLLSFNF